jgi:ribulose bisphosphate carboxylase small subunit
MKHPEALRLAETLDAYHTAPHHKQAAAELRRLHEVNAALLEALQCRAKVDSAYVRLSASDIDEDTHERLLEEIDDAENTAKELSIAAIAKATGEQP